MSATTMTCATRTQEYSEGHTETLAEGLIRNAAEVRMGTTCTRAGVSGTGAAAELPSLSFGAKHHLSPLPPCLN